MSSSPTKIELEPIEHPALILPSQRVIGGPGVGVIESSEGFIVHDTSLPRSRRSTQAAAQPAQENPLKWMMFACSQPVDGDVTVNGGRVHYVDKHPTTQDWIRKFFDVGDATVEITDTPGDIAEINGFIFLKVTVAVGDGPSDPSSGTWSIESVDYAWTLERTTTVLLPELVSPAPAFEFLESEPAYEALSGVQYFLLARVVSGNVRQKHVGAIHLPQWSETTVDTFNVTS